MQKLFLYIILFLTLSLQLSAECEVLDWTALEEEVCILDNTISDFNAVLLPAKELENKDPETKMPESGIFCSNCRNTISLFADGNLLTPFVNAINGYSGFTNLANAP